MREGCSRKYNACYTGRHLEQIAFPLGGMGAGMICVEGSGALSKFSLRHQPELCAEHRAFAAISMRDTGVARVLEGPVAEWKRRPRHPGKLGLAPNMFLGLPRFRAASFEARFPFAKVRLLDESFPLQAELTAWSPFAPGDADNACLPVAAMEYSFVNPGRSTVEAEFWFSAGNFMACPDPTDKQSLAADFIRASPGGFVLGERGSEHRASDEGYFAAWLESTEQAGVQTWFKGESRAQIQMLWRDITTGVRQARVPDGADSYPGVSLFAPLRLAPGETRTLRLHLAWYVPRSNLFEPSFFFRQGRFDSVESSDAHYQPWYSTRFASLETLQEYWTGHYAALRQASQRFSDTLFDSTLPDEVMEAVAANLSILKSPTVLRQADGRLWGWEGCFDEVGSWYGSANHVWNFAQSLAHLFPDLERTLRETELGENLGADGFQAIRAALPTRRIGDSREDAWGFPAAADGQFGTIIKVYRDWRISGDAAWLRRLWPKIELSLDYAINAWDPRRRGVIEEPHFNTYDVEFWGPDGLCTGAYAGALKAAILMGEALGEDVDGYTRLYGAAVRSLEDFLFNGEYFFQRVEWRRLRAEFPPHDGPLANLLRRHPEQLRVAQEEGPPYQVGEGCLSDAMLGAWLCSLVGVGEILDGNKVASHLDAVFRHNFQQSLHDRVNLSRGFLGCAEEAGLVVCSWPKDRRPSLPMYMGDEVWTGVEYMVASHLALLGRIDAARQVVRACRNRYDGRVRNPFGEVEAGHWYARAMSSYALLQAFSGARFDAVDRVLHLRPAIKGDFRCFLSTATGYGTVGVRDGAPFLDVVAGEIACRSIEYTPA
ncbi:GH116 family glycosyl hydrolase [Peristeroidobacter soli]|uniref:GH116 family glycosyl hydrolase n=1 Tax=Peristeroidobacter soli TaxID=2497877 RepID=UPI00101D98EB|nr:GH116 family glycosyl hydrolase [Peristeroidobacter soli]